MTREEEEREARAGRQHQPRLDEELEQVATDREVTGSGGGGHRERPAVKGWANRWRKEKFWAHGSSCRRRPEPVTMDHSKSTPREGPTYKAPDGGYGWVIVFSSFILQAISGGIAFSVGIYFVEFLETFGQGKGETAWIGSINTGILFGAGPIASMLANRFGHRCIIILGGFMSAVGILMSSFATDIYYLYFSYGMITGCGFCFTYVPSVVVVGFYFEKRRNLAMGIAAAGFGAGNFIFAPILRGLVVIFGWRGAMIITSGFCLNCCVLGALMCPVSYWAAPIVTEVECKPTPADAKKEESSYGGRAAEEAATYARQLAVIFNVSLLKDARFLLFLTNNVLWNIGSLILLHFCADYAIYSGVGKGAGAILISTLGGCSLLGRLAIAVIGSHPSIDRFYVFIASTATSGLAIALFPTRQQLEMLAVWAATYGLSFGCQVGVLAVVTAELFGVHRLTSAYGYLMFGNGAGAMLGPPIAGWIYEATRRYEVAFYFGGALTLLSAAILILIPVLQRRKQRRANRDGKGDYYIGSDYYISSGDLPQSCISLKSGDGESIA